MADLASLIVRLEAETARYQRELERARRDLQRFQNSAKVSVKDIAKSVGAAALAAAVALAAMAKSAIDTADSLYDLSKITGISVESLSQLRFAAEQSGTDLEGLTAGLRKFAKQASEAASGSDSAAESFERIGVKVTDANGKIKSTEALLLEVADKFAMYRNGAAKAALAQEIFGKSGAALIPFLNNGADGIKELMKQADALGLTIKTKTAIAADQFNDNLNKLKFQVSTLGLQVAEKFLPALLDITEALSELAKDKQDIGGFLDGIAEGFRFIVGLGVAVADTFDDLGRGIGFLWAVQVAAAKDGIAGAKVVFDEYRAASIAAEERTTKLLDKLWGERADKYNRSLEKYATGGPTSRNRTNRKRQGLETPLLDVPLPKQVISPVQEIEIKIPKIESDEIADYYADLEKRTRTQTEQTLAAYAVDKYSLKQLLDEKLISQEQYAARLKEIQTRVLNDISQGAPKVEEETKKINEYMLEAARNSQDIIADTFTDLALGAEVSAKSILKSFAEMIVRLAAQAAAANLAGKLFGEAAGGATGSGGFVGTALGALGKAFGGTKDRGGRGYPGMAYAIGTGAQPEVFVPDTAGTFVPAGKRGGQSVQINFTIAGDAPISRRTQMQIAAAASRGVTRANRRNN